MAAAGEGVERRTRRPSRLRAAIAIAIAGGVVPLCLLRIRNFLQMLLASSLRLNDSVGKAWGWEDGLRRRTSPTIAEKGQGAEGLFKRG